MLLETTYGKPKNYQKGKSLVGRPFSIFKIFKMRGSSSPRFFIESTNLAVDYHKELQSDLDAAMIEIRRNGIIVHINVKLQIFEWMIPYYQLVLYKTNEYFSIHAHGRFLQFTLDKSHIEHLKFINKLVFEKESHMSQYHFIDGR
ncbi:hypothetical protein [Flammeovirga sp. SubArs3]|uniref:hypothetical protein n=1 Tax=Flammeovirga sp. SubArs3 TaxID=2995316 RepID=UPI00248D06DF|nr:hypothetical protein [Flammeovirga sp. SubArs3]